MRHPWSSVPVANKVRAGKGRRSAWVDKLAVVGSFAGMAGCHALLRCAGELAKHHASLANLRQWYNTRPHIGSRGRRRARGVQSGALTQKKKRQRLPVEEPRIHGEGGSEVGLHQERHANQGGLVGMTKCAVPTPVGQQKAPFPWLFDSRRNKQPFVGDFTRRLVPGRRAGAHFHRRQGSRGARPGIGRLQQNSERRQQNFVVDPTGVFFERLLPRCVGDQRDDHPGSFGWTDNPCSQFQYSCTQRFFFFY